MTDAGGPISFGNKPAVLNVVSGSISNAQLNTMTASVSLALVPAPGAGLWNRIENVQLVVAAANPRTALTIGGTAHIRLGYVAAQVPPAGPGAITTIMAGGDTISGNAVCSPAGGTALTDAMFTTAPSAGTTLSTCFKVLNVDNTGPTLFAGANPYTNCAFCLGASGACSAAVGLTVFYRVVYETLPATTA